MIKAELTQWFNESFWERYKILMKTPFPTKWKAGTKGEALKKMLTLNPNTALRDRIGQAVDAQINNRKTLFEQCGSMQVYLKKVEYSKFYSNRNGSTWINNLGWEDEIPQIVKALPGQKEHETFCKTPSCPFTTHGPSFEYCTQCTGRNNDDELKTQLRKMNMGIHKNESVQDYSARCRAKFKALMSQMGL